MTVYSRHYTKVPPAAQREKLKRLVVPAPLFDRLCDAPNEELGWGRHAVLDLENLKSSIQDEVNLIANSRRMDQDLRSADGLPSTEALEAMPQAFGLYDFNHLDVSNQLGRARMEREMEDMITRFEPRLRRVRVKVVELNRSENKLICTVSADMVMDQVH
ncbi:MAG: type VI secretion system baseplate subunit TssE, partial [Holosporales bacterium]